VLLAWVRGITRTGAAVGAGAFRAAGAAGGGLAIVLVAITGLRTSFLAAVVVLGAPPNSPANMPPAADGAAALVAFLGAAVGAGLLGAAGFLISALTGVAGVFLGAAAAGGEPKRPENRPPRGETSCVLGLLGVTTFVGGDGFLISGFFITGFGAAVGAFTMGFGAGVGPPPMRATVGRPCVFRRFGPISIGAAYDGGAAETAGFLTSNFSAGGACLTGAAAGAPPNRPENRPATGASVGAALPFSAAGGAVGLAATLTAGLAATALGASTFGAADGAATIGFGGVSAAVVLDGGRDVCRLTLGPTSWGAAKDPGWAGVTLRTSFCTAAGFLASVTAPPRRPPTEGADGFATGRADTFGAGETAGFTAAGLAGCALGVVGAGGSPPKSPAKMPPAGVTFSTLVTSLALGAAGVFGLAAVTAGGVGGAFLTGAGSARMDRSASCFSWKVLGLGGASVGASPTATALASAGLGAGFGCSFGLETGAAGAPPKRPAKSPPSSSLGASFFPTAGALVGVGAAVGATLGTGASVGFTSAARGGWPVGALRAFGAEIISSSTAGFTGVTGFSAVVGAPPKTPVKRPPVTAGSGAGPLLTSFLGGGLVSSATGVTESFFVVLAGFGGAAGFLLAASGLLTIITPSGVRSTATGSFLPFSRGFSSTLVLTGVGLGPSGAPPKTPPNAAPTAGAPTSRGLPGAAALGAAGAFGFGAGLGASSIPSASLTCLVTLVGVSRT